MADNKLTPEEEIRYLKKQLSAAQRMAALGELASTTTHEFNNVLMTVINYAKTGAATRGRRDPRESVSTASSVRASELPRSPTRSWPWPAIASDEPNRPILGRLIEDALVLLEREMNKYRVHVDYTVSDDVPKIMAIGNQLQQVVLNLLINARQAMQSGW